MKYLLQSDWERLVKNAERYEALLAILAREDGTAKLIRGGSIKRPVIDARMDEELDHQANASRRANGGTDCVVCGKPYRSHPKGGPLGVGDEQFLNRLCDGSLVKL
jgi:hypothetical protein